MADAGDTQRLGPGTDFLTPVRVVDTVVPTDGVGVSYELNDLPLPTTADRSSTRRGNPQAIGISRLGLPQGTEPTGRGIHVTNAFDNREVSTTDRDTERVPFLQDLTGLEGGVKFRYKMRGQDDGVPAPGFVTWTADFPDFTGSQVGTSVPPLVGSLIPGSTVVVSVWAPT